MPSCLAHCNYACATAIVHARRDRFKRTRSRRAARAWLHRALAAKSGSAPHRSRSDLCRDERPMRRLPSGDLASERCHPSCPWSTARVAISLRRARCRCLPAREMHVKAFSLIRTMRCRAYGNRVGGVAWAVRPVRQRRARRRAPDRVSCVAAALAARRRPREPIGRGWWTLNKNRPAGLKVLRKFPPSYRRSWASVNVDHFDRGRS